MFNNTPHRPATIQRIRIGATKDGKITAIGHESWSGDLPGGKPEAAVQADAPALCRRKPPDGDRLAVLDLPEGNAMRAPGEAPGMMALEIAIDEMAEKLGLDPVEFRIINDTQVVPDNPAAHPRKIRRPTRNRRPVPQRPAARFRSVSWSSAFARAPKDSVGTNALPGLPRSARDVGSSAWESRPLSATTR